MELNLGMRVVAHPTIRAALAGTAGVLFSLYVGVSQAQLFQSLQTVSQSIPVGSGQTDPASGARQDGPRWVSAADFDKDGHADFATCHLNGEISVAWGRGDGSFDGPHVLDSGTTDLRAMVAGDLNGDGRPDLAAASPFDGLVTLLFSLPQERGFASPVLVPTFKRGRNLEAGDFDGDGRLDLAVGGPDEWFNPDDPNDPNQVRTGVVYLRGTGGGAFERLGTVPAVGLPHLANSNLRPVYSLQSFRRPWETQDTLAVTHQHSSAIWLLRANGPGPLEVSETFSWFGNGPQEMGASPYLVDSLKIGTIFSPIQTGEMDLMAVMQQM